MKAIEYLKQRGRCVHGNNEWVTTYKIEVLSKNGEYENDEHFYIELVGNSIRKIQKRDYTQIMYSLCVSHIETAEELLTLLKLIERDDK